MTDKNCRQPDFFREEGKSPMHGEVGTETIDLNSLFAKEVTDSGSFAIQGEIWTTTFGKVLQALPIPVFLIDQARNVMAANQACRKIGAEYDTMDGRQAFFVSLRKSVGRVARRLPCKYGSLHRKDIGLGSAAQNR